MRIQTSLALGVLLATSAGAQTKPTASVPTLRATVDLAIGSGTDETRDEYMLSAVGGLATDKNGQILVAEAEANLIRVYSSSGKYLYTIGQKGQGPGDLFQPSNIAFDATGRLWVREARNHRISVFIPAAPRAQFVRAIRTEASSMYGSSDRLHWDDAGHVVDFRSAPPRPGDPYRLMRLFLDTAGTVIFTDTAPPISRDSIEEWNFKTSNGSSTYYKPFGSNRIQAFGGRGLAAFATNTNYAVSLVDAHGKQIALLRQEVTPVVLSAKDLALVAERKEAIAKNVKVPVSSLSFDMPRTKPVIASLMFDIDGRLWVEQAVVEGAPHTADVYDAKGKQTAVMQWPSNTSLRDGAVSGRTGLAVQRDADGVQTVVRLVWR